jgi:hypothetical protein
MIVRELMDMLSMLDPKSYIGIGVQYEDGSSAIYHPHPMIYVSAQMPELAVLEVDGAAIIIESEGDDD